MHDDDDHFKRRSSKPQVLEETDGFEADIDSPISKTGEPAPLPLCVYVCVSVRAMVLLETVARVHSRPLCGYSPELLCGCLVVSVSG